MLRTTVILLSLISLSRSDLLFPYPLADDLIYYTAQGEAGRSNDSMCSNVQLNYCQYQFNQAIGLMNDSINYRNGTIIFNTVNQFLSANVTEFHRICRARSNFHACLGQSYYSCLNLHTRLDSNDTSYANAFDYVRTFRGLEWICGGGFREVINQFDCFNGLTTTNSYQNCMNTFDHTVSTSNFCPAIQTTSMCLNDVFKNACGDPTAGHYGCENFRFTFDHACPQLRCHVNN